MAIHCQTQLREEIHLQEVATQAKCNSVGSHFTYAKRALGMLSGCCQTRLQLPLEGLDHSPSRTPSVGDTESFRNSPAQRDLKRSACTFTAKTLCGGARPPDWAPKPSQNL